MLGLAKRDSERNVGPQTGNTVSPVLWQAALDTLGFAGFASEDPMTGLHRHELVFAAGQAERAAAGQRLHPVAGVALGFAVGHGRSAGAVADRRSGADAPVSRETVADLETAILLRARQIHAERYRSTMNYKLGTQSAVPARRRRAASGTGMSRYNFRENEAKWQRTWRERRSFEAREDAGAPEILRPRDVPVPVRQTACRARAQLHDGRPRRALPPRAGLQRAAPDGLGRVRPAGRERRDRRQRPSGEMDRREHRDDARPVAAHGVRL